MAIFLTLFLGLAVHFANCRSNGDHGTTKASQARLRVVTIQAEPYVRLKWEPGLIGNDRYEGYYIDLLRAIALEAGFDFQLQLTTDSLIGSYSQEAQWSGMIGELSRRSVDLAVGPIVITSDRKSVVDFSVPVNEVYLSFVQNAKNNRSTKSVRELLDSTSVTFDILRNSEAASLLKHSTNRNLGRIWTKIWRNRHHSMLDNIYEGLEKVRRNNHVLILDSDVSRYHMGKPPCDLAVVVDRSTRYHYAFAMPNGSDILHDVNTAIRRLQARRDMWRRLQDKWWRSNCGQAATVENGLDESQSETGVLPGKTGAITARRRLTIAAMVTEPYVIQDQSGGYTGYIVDLIERMSSIVPFDYEWKIGKKFGKRKRNGQWTGLIGSLFNQEADIAAAPFTINKRHKQVLTFTKPFLHSTLSILIKEPQPGQELNIFFMEDLVNQTRMQFGVIRGSRAEKHIRKSKLPLYKEIWRRIRQPVPVDQSTPEVLRHKRHQHSGNIIPTLSAGISRVREDGFALIVENTEATYLASKYPCDLLSLDQFLSITHYAFALKKENPLVEDIDKALIRLQQDGILQILFHKWWGSDECLGEGDNTRIVVYNASGTSHTGSNISVSNVRSSHPPSQPIGKKREERNRHETIASTSTRKPYIQPIQTSSEMTKTVENVRQVNTEVHTMADNSSMPSSHAYEVSSENVDQYHEQTTVINYNNPLAERTEDKFDSSNSEEEYEDEKPENEIDDSSDYELVAPNENAEVTDGYREGYILQVFPTGPYWNESSNIAASSAGYKLQVTTSFYITISVLLLSVKLPLIYGER